MNLKMAFSDAIHLAKNERKEYLCPEHLLFALITQPPFKRALLSVSINANMLRKRVSDYITKLYSVPDGKPYELESSWMLNQIMAIALEGAEAAKVKVIDVPHVFNAMIACDDCWATQLLLEASDNNSLRVLEAVMLEYKRSAEEDEYAADKESSPSADPKKEAWMQYVTCMTDLSASHHPLVGREDEMERTLQVLCRHEKNNPLHIGEPGVGKTALAWGLAQRLSSGQVPARLKGYRMYELHIANIVAGAQFHGELEQRLKGTLEGIASEGPAIVYIDNLHNLVGAGRNGDSAMDATQILRPFMDSEELRFVGSTTYQDYNHHMSKQRSWTRRFQQIDIAEPSQDETIRILRTLAPLYESYHKVHYDEDVIPYAVEMSARHINERFMPDKAIDLIDEAGAWRELHPLTRKYRGEEKVCRRQAVDKHVINMLLARICRISAESLYAESNEKLQTLASRIKAQIYGQDEAVDKLATSVEMAKAGLLDEEKPLASLLFVGPTGVGKTELARVLSKELGVSLVRFDMSEYTEKHTVAKLIGSPAGYVGYEDGGLLTDAIRKTPNCVLLLDEIEKAHSDIYNILLQVMDYGQLTDNRGNKADFRHVVLIMTSNAGAQYAAQASIGFGNSTTTGDAMMKEVHKTFKPEFINRLSGTVVFRDMDRHMATLILDKKLQQLQEKLNARKVTLKLSEQARNLLLDKGFTTRYGAREIDRIIQQMLSPLLMRELLYGSLTKGGIATVDRVEDGLAIINSQK